SLTASKKTVFARPVEATFLAVCPNSYMAVFFFPKYAAPGERIETDVDPDGAGLQGTTVMRFAFDGGAIWADLNGSNALQTRRLYLDAVDSVFARVSSGGTAAWYLPDRLGSIRDMADNTGALQDHIDYDGYGKVTSESSSSFGDREKYTGRELDTET